MEMKNNDPDQRTDDWLKLRLGFFTGSEIGKLMGKPKPESKIFTKTAMSYIYQIAAERDLLDKVLNDEYLWDIYKEQTEKHSKAMEFGTEYEPIARDQYTNYTGIEMDIPSSVVHPTIPFFSASPDGYNEKENVCLEIKVPNINTFYQYKTEIKDAETLKSVNDVYYYQVLSEMLMTGAKRCDFVAFNPFLKHNLHIAQIFPNEKDISELIERVQLANEKVDEILNK